MFGKILITKNKRKLATREKEIAVKTGAKRVFINNVWIYLENKEKIEEMVNEIERKKKDRKQKRKTGDQ